MDATVIVPVRNVEPTLAHQLSALSEQRTTLRWEVIVVDNGSTDRSAEVAEGFGTRLPALTVVSAADRFSAGHARNVGAAYARGRALLFCDADDVVAAGWLDGLACALERFDAVGGPIDDAVLNEPPTTYIRRTLVTTNGFPEVMGWRRAGAGNLAVRKPVFNALGGFDPDWTISEDTEFCLRLQVEGYSLGFTADAVVNCRHRPGAWANLVQVYRWGRGRPALYRRFRTAGAVRRSTPRSVLGVARRLPTSIRSRPAWWAWLGDVARLLGRVRGSIHERTWYV